MRYRILMIMAIIMQFLLVFTPSLANRKKPRVSLIASVYNGDEFIDGFLQDIVGQTIFPESELIVINANSPGYEEAVIKDYMEKYENIIYVKLSYDPGVYGVWNMGIRLANAPLVSNANLDDRRNPESLKTHVEYLEMFPDIDLVYSNYYITEKPNIFYKENLACMYSDPPHFSPSAMNFCLPGPQPVWRKSLHEKYGYFNESFLYLGDHEMWNRAVRLGAYFAKLPGLSGVYYNNPQGLSTSETGRAYEIRMSEKLKIRAIYGYLWANFRD